MKTLIFDTETSGLWDNTLIDLDKQPKIIEFFGVVIDDETGEELDEFESFVLIDEDLSYKRPKKGGGFERSIFEITGINNEMLVGAPRFPVIAQNVKAIIESADLVVAHNMIYDYEVVNFEFKRIGQSVNWPPMIDTVEKTEWLKSFRLSLSDLHEFLFGEKFAGAHRARYDVMALKRCYLELKKRGLV